MLAPLLFLISKSLSTKIYIVLVLAEEYIFKFIVIKYYYIVQVASKIHEFWLNRLFSHAYILNSTSNK